MPKQLNFILLFLLLCSFTLNVYWYLSNDDRKQQILQLNALLKHGEGGGDSAEEGLFAMGDSSSSRVYTGGARHEYDQSGSFPPSELGASNARAAQDNDGDYSDIQDFQSDEVSSALAMKLFNQTLFDQAIDVYQELLYSNEMDAKAVRDDWLSQAQSWLNDKKLSKLIPFLSLFTVAQPYDLDFLALDAERQAATGDIVSAVDSYYFITNNSFEPNKQQFWFTRIYQLTELHYKQLFEQEAWPLIIETSENWLDKDEQASYYYALAYALFQVQSYYQASANLRPIMDDSRFQVKAQDLQDKIDKAMQGERLVALTKRGAHYVLPAVVSEQGNVKLMLDTGASYTVVSNERFNDISSQINYEYIGELTMNTAGGRANASRYKVSSFQIDQFVLEDFTLVVMDLHALKGADGLLGMNFFNHFKFRIDQDEDQLILQAR